MLTANNTLCVLDWQSSFCIVNQYNVSNHKQEYYNYKMAAVLGIMVFIVCAVFTVVCFHFINKKEATFS